MKRPIYDTDKLATIVRDTGISSDYDNIRPVHAPIVSRTSGGGDITPWHVEHTAKAFRAIYNANYIAPENKAGIRLSAHSVALQYETSYIFSRDSGDVSSKFNIKEFLISCGFTVDDLELYNL